MTDTTGLRHKLAAFLDLLPPYVPESPGQDLAELVEVLMDHCGIADLLSIVANVCNEKADHVRTTWQDASLARSWDRVAKALDRAEETARRELPVYRAITECREPGDERLTLRP